MANDNHARGLAFIRERFSNHSPKINQLGSNVRQAAVAIVVRALADSLDVLFIKRARSEGDPWSGQMAFPGGHLDAADESLQMAAIRETFEETGVHLSTDQFLGQLTYQRPASRSGRNPLFVVPFVFGLEDNPMIRINHEVDQVVWGSLAHMMDGTLHASETFTFAGTSAKFNGYQLGEEKFVWGLTYRTLQDFFSVLDPHYKVPSEPV